MKVALLIYEPNLDHPTGTAEEQATVWAAWSAYIKDVSESGYMLGGEGLQPPATASTVSLKDGKLFVQDGPFADTREQLGGFFLLDVPSLEVAHEWAAKCPAAPNGHIEVRPIMIETP